MSSIGTALFETSYESLELLGRGKVRDIYAINDELMLFVASDRLSAFDVVLPDPIPGKGRVLTQLSDFWFARSTQIVKNHREGTPAIADVVASDIVAELDGRGSVVQRVKPLPVEAIVRGYLIGSGWNDYQRTGLVCGIELPAGLEQASQLAEPIFTPSTKADVGLHDENIDFARAAELIGTQTANRIRDISIELYTTAAEFALSKGIIIADTKFEFGLDDAGEIILIDECLTPDSSRFWPQDQYELGTSPPSYDKQFVRDYLESVGWNKTPPGPSLPADIIEKTAEKYQEAYEQLTS